MWLILLIFFSAIINLFGGSNGNVSIIAQDGETQDENVSPSDDNISTDPTDLKHEQAKVDIVPPSLSTGFQNLPVSQTPRDYNYGFFPPLMGSHFVQVDIPELQASLLTAIQKL